MLHSDMEKDYLRVRKAKNKKTHEIFKKIFT